MATIHSEMNRLAKDTHRQRLKAIGQRLKLDNTTSSEEGLLREEELVQSRIETKEEEMEEFTSYLASLENAEREQLAEIENLESGRS